jgi:haloalkane dehalogenase
MAHALTVPAPTALSSASLPAWLDRNEYPFQPLTFDTPEGRMRYLDEGTGAPVLIVHGTPSWSFEWRHVVRGLTPRCRLVVPDHLGFGLSDKPGDASILRPEDHARRLLALVDALDLNDLVLVVHDFGGPIGLPIALERSTRVRSVVVLNSWMWPNSGDKQARTLSRVIASPLGKLLYLGLNASPRWLVPAAFHDRARLTPAVHRHYLAPFGSWAARRGPWALGVALTGSDPFYATLEARRETLARIPLELVWGRHDPAFGPPVLARWKSMFPHAKATDLEVGHFPAEEAPEAVVNAIRRALP